MLDSITPLILTYNEAPNIHRTLEKLTWAEKIIVIDSYSTDKTLEILCDYPQIQVFQRKFDSFASQCNYGLEKITSEWVLSLDADYVLTDRFINEIHALLTQSVLTHSQINSYNVAFKYCVFGNPLRGTLLPPRKILYRRKKASYKNDGHAHRVEVLGESFLLKSFIYHDDRKPLNRWLQSQDRYMILEAKKLSLTPIFKLSLSDRIRKTKILAPFIILFYCLIIKGCLLDGWAGWYYTLQRMLAEIWLSIRLIEYEVINKEK